MASPEDDTRRLKRARRSAGNPSPATPDRVQVPASKDRLSLMQVSVQKAHACHTLETCAFSGSPLSTTITTSSVRHHRDRSIVQISPYHGAHSEALEASRIVEFGQLDASVPSCNDTDEDDGTGSTMQNAALCVELGQVIPGACDALLETAHQLVDALKGLKFKLPVTCVYNPLVYAINLYEQYVRKHGGRRIEVLLVGMNPGPFGMAQTGVPFGDRSMVCDFHGILGEVDSPFPSHPKRPIYGLKCPRPEVSGQRLWGWARERFGSATAFFKQFWVYNYCPLVFMEASGKNRTPDKLHPAERRELEVICNKALENTISILQPSIVVGIGKYAASKIHECSIMGIKVGDIMHPSPANPHANKDWSKKIEAQLTAIGVVLK